MAVIGQDREHIRKLIESHSTFGTTLLAILLDEFGVEMFEWEPQTIRMEIFDTYGSNMPQLNQDKLWSLITALTTNQFYVSLEIYRATCSALYNDEPDFGIWEPSTPEELAWGVSEVLLNDPFDDAHPNKEFSNEIEQYTGLTLTENGILEPPKILQFASYGADNPVLDLDSAFVDDPAMFEAAWGSQQVRKLEIENMITQRTRALIKELSELPLQNANNKFMDKLKASASV